MRKINLQMLNQAIRQANFPQNPKPGDVYSFLVYGYADYLNFVKYTPNEQINFNATADVINCVAVEYRRKGDRTSIEWELEI